MNLLVIVLAYLIGSIPMGYLVIRFSKQQDLTQIASGRTGATNAARAGGAGAGLATGILDGIKGAGAIWFARVLLGGNPFAIADPLVESIAGIAAVAGHNYSIYLKFHGGAGTGPNVGAAIAFQPIAALVLPVLVPLVLITTGYASVASIAAAVAIPAIFLLSHFIFATPLEYVFFGVCTFALVVWSLRPNIARLRAGEERMVGPRAKRRESAK